MVIFVGGLTDATQEQQLHELFKPFGKISTMRLVRHSITQESMRYGFVTMPMEAEAQAAVEALSGYRLDGRKLTVQDAETDKRRHNGR
jgi:RNA recognition motif-containing protein